MKDKYHENSFSLKFNYYVGSTGGGCGIVKSLSRDYSAKEIGAGRVEMIMCEAFGTGNEGPQCKYDEGKYVSSDPILQQKVSTGNEKLKLDPTQQPLVFKQVQACLKSGPENESECRAKRNTAIAKLIIDSDELCTGHLTYVFGSEATINIGFGTAATLLSGAATVAGTTGAKTLSALSAFASSERSLFNEVIYKTALITAISAKIREGQLEKLEKIRQRMRSDNFRNYAMGEAMLDIFKYHHTCSFMYGLEKALEEGNQNGTAKHKAEIEADITKLEGKRDSLKLKLDVAKNDDAYKKSIEKEFDLINGRISELIGELSKIAIPQKAQSEVEVDQAKAGTEKAKEEADKAKAEADKAKTEAKNQVGIAKTEAEADKAEAEAEKAEAEAKKAEAEAKKAEADKAKADKAKAKAEKEEANKARETKNAR